MATSDIFMTGNQAVEAIHNDFAQYPPQLLIYGEVLRLISKGTIQYRRDPGKQGAWISEHGRRNMRWLKGSELTLYMINTLSDASLDLDQIATLCACVFQTRAYVGRSSGSNEPGIIIETGMDAYTCRQCGQCCRTLDYHKEVMREDVRSWERSGRDDILEWVGEFQENGQTVYRIWMQPGTRKLATVCPFLKACGTQKSWICSIHDAKPTICQNYPVSRKHALMTGCKGFGAPHADHT